MKYAHFYKFGGTQWVDITTDIAGRDIVKQVMVASRAEAREAATANNATPWNF